MCQGCTIHIPLMRPMAIACQVLMLNKSSLPMSFGELNPEDKDLTMFRMTDLTLEKENNTNMVYMALKLKRKVVTELLTTYLPTILLLLITFTTIFFDRDLFGDAIAVNLTIMLVMTTIFTSKMVRFTAMTSPKRSLSKKMVTKVMRSRRMVGR